MHTTQGLRALDMRDDLEKQVLGLAHQRDALEADMTSMANMQHSVQELEAEVCVCVGGGGRGRLESVDSRLLRLAGQGVAQSRPYPHLGDMPG